MVIRPQAGHCRYMTLVGGGGEAKLSGLKAICLKAQNKHLCQMKQQFLIPEDRKTRVRSGTLERA